MALRAPVVAPSVQACTLPTALAASQATPYRTEVATMEDLGQATMQAVGLSTLVQLSTLVFQVSTPAMSVNQATPWVLLPQCAPA